MSKVYINLDGSFQTTSGTIAANSSATLPFPPKVLWLACSDSALRISNSNGVVVIGSYDDSVVTYNSTNRTITNQNTYIPVRYAAIG